MHLGQKKPESPPNPLEIKVSLSSFFSLTPLNRAKEQQLLREPLLLIQYSILSLDQQREPLWGLGA